MRKLSKKISMLMVLAMLVSLFSGVVSASAASMWSFKSTNGKFDVAVKETIIMEKNEYADFDLYKEGEKVTKATYTAVWESSDPDVVWVDATNGRLRADKFGKAEAGDKAMISATFTNVETKKSATRSFYIEIAADPVVEEPEVDYKIAVNFGDEAFLVGDKYDLEGVVTADGVAIEADVVFSINGKAIEGAYAPTEAGDVTIVATATIDGEEWTAEYKCEVLKKPVAITSVKQIALNQIRVQFSDASYAAQAVAAANEDIEATFELTFNADKDLAEGNNRVDHELFYAEVDAEDATCVNIYTYKKLGEGLKYKIAYKPVEDAYGWVTGTGIVPADVEITETEYVIDADRLIEYEIYNKEGVIINSISAADGGFDEDDYPIEWTLVSDEVEDVDFNAEDATIYFFEKGAKANVKVTIDMGYDDDGNELADLSDKETLVGVDATDKEIVLDKYVVVKNGSGDFMTGTQQLFVAEGDDPDELYLKAHYTTKDKFGGPAEYVVYQGKSTDEENTDVFTYQSSNTDIVAIDEDYGRVHPVAQGTAKLYVKRDGKVIGYHTVKVWKQQELASFKVTVEKGSKVSVVEEALKENHCGIEEYNYAKVKVSHADQRGTALENPVAVEYELDQTIKSIDGTAYKGAEGLEALFEAGYEASGIFTPATDMFTNEDTGILMPGKKVTVRIKATAYYTCDDGKEMEKVSKFSFTIKNIKDVKAEAPVLTVTDTVDVTLGACRVDIAKDGAIDKYNHASRTGNIELVQSDRERFFIRNVPFAEVNLSNAKNADGTDEEAKATTKDAYTVVITKGDFTIDETLDSFNEKKVKVTPNMSETVCVSHGTIKVTLEMCKPDDTDANKIVTADTGSYKVRLYKGNGVGKNPTLVTTKYMKVVDNGDALKTEKIREYITGFNTIQELSEALKFTYNGVEVKYDDVNHEGLYLIDEFNGFNLTDKVKYDYKSDDTSRVYIYSIKVNVPIKAYNKGWNNGDEYTVMEIIVDKTFTLYKD